MLQILRDTARRCLAFSISYSLIYIHLLVLMWLQMEGTVKPFPNFNADHDCEVLRKAMKGLGKNHSKIRYGDKNAFYTLICITGHEYHRPK